MHRPRLGHELFTLLRLLLGGSQVVMAVLAYQYYNSYAASVDTLSVGAVMSAVLQLDARQQLVLFQRLGNLLAASDMVPEQMAQQYQHVPGLDPVSMPAHLESG